MMKIYTTVFGGFMISVWMLITSRGDTKVSCVFMEQCMLPCTSDGITELIIHWYKTAENLQVHSFYYSQDQLGSQHQQFRGRTSLFKDQLTRGNASLQLTGVKVRDEGRYKCHTSTVQGNRDSFSDLKVNAPVQKVKIQRAGKQMICSSERLYPQPDLTWTTSSPSNMSLQYETKVQQSEEQLYSISSALHVSDGHNNLDYSCTISTRRNKKRATLSRLSSVIGSYIETTISCSPSNTSLTNLIWRFNQSQTILTKTGSDGNHTVSERWKQHVKDVSESGSLTLQDLSSDQEGTYTCELSDAEETIITHIFVRINERNSSSTKRIIGWVLAVVLVGAGGAGLVLYCIKKRGQLENSRRSTFDENILKLTADGLSSSSPSII